MMRPLRESLALYESAAFTHKAFNLIALLKRSGFCRYPRESTQLVVRPKLPHLVRGMDAENGEARCQDRDDALNHCQPRLCKICIIIDNEA